MRTQKYRRRVEKARKGGVSQLEGEKAAHGMKNSMNISLLFPMKSSSPQTSVQQSMYLP